MGTSKVNLAFLAIVVSILIHLSFFGGLSLLTPASFQKSKGVVEFEILPQPSADVKRQNRSDDKKLMQIVEQNKINSDIDPKAEFLSSHNQRIVKETVAQNRGEFRNSAGTGKATNVSASTKAAKPAKQLDLFGKYSMDELAKKASSSSESAGGNGTETSQTRDYLKGRDPGLQTMLSTREFVYYTYYNRIRNQLSQHWESTIKVKMAAIYRQGRSIASDSDKITKVLITLNNQGTLMRVQVMSESGVRDLDDAAVEAFRLAAPFPNPPKGIVDADGTIKIRWDFVIEV